MDVDSSRKYIFPTTHTASHEVSEETSEKPYSGSPWQTVKRRRARSLDSAQPAPSKKSGHRGRAPEEKIPAAATKYSNVAQAAAKATPEAVQIRREALVESRCEGPSQLKEKIGIPTNGGISI
jgi:hypothetical protein